MTELKKCPFCGEMPTLEQYNNGMWWIKCENPKCQIAPFTDMNKSRAVIVREWNRRAE